MSGLDLLQASPNATSEATTSTDNSLNPTVDFFAGTVAGITGLVVGFPLDTVKVRFQNPETAIKYRTTAHAISTIIREEKFLGLFKGITSPLASSALLNGFVFASYRFFMKLQPGTKDDIPTLTQITLAGVETGIAFSFVNTPVELIKIRQQNYIGKAPSAFNTALHIFKSHGVSGLYRGFTASALRDTRYGAYFFSYEATCRALTPASSVDAASRPTWRTLSFAGGVAGAFAWFVTFPLDVVKTRIQGTERGFAGAVLPFGASKYPEKRGFHLQEINPYQNTLSTIVHSYRTEGIGVFFRGLTPTLIRAFPVGVITFATFEVVGRSLS